MKNIFEKKNKVTNIGIGSFDFVSLYTSVSGGTLSEKMVKEMTRRERRKKLKQIENNIDGR